MSSGMTFGQLIDPVRFAIQVLGFTPDEPQTRVLETQTRYGILNCTRQWGKSTICAVKALHKALAEPDSLIVILTPSDRQSREFVRKTGTFVRKLGIQKRGDGDNDCSILLPNGSRIVGLPGREATIRCFSGVSLLLIDEASKVPDELYLTVRPVVAVSNGDVWLMSTPAGKQGFFWNEWSDGGDDWTRITVPATECPRIPRKFLEKEKRVHGERSFRQEYMCEFVGANDSLFNEELLRSLITTDFRPLYPKGHPGSRPW